jgi:hypothetical protein
MKAAARLFVVMALVAAAPAMSKENASPSPGPMLTGHLKCGEAQLTAQTQYLDVPSRDRQVLTQTLELTNPGKGTTKLAHDGRVFRQPFLKDTPVLDASATGWACLEGTGGKRYVYVLYTCTESPARPRCAGTKREWPRLFDTEGAPLNARYPHSGSRTPALMKKLGLGHYLSEGVSLEDVTE